MKVRQCAFVAMLLIGAGTISAVPEEKSDLKSKVAALVDQLGIPVKKVAAETELIKLGPDVLPLLPANEARLSPSQVESLKKIRGTLQEAQVMRQLGPRMVTLKSQVPLAEALDQVQKQTGIAVVDRREGGDNPVLKLNLDNVTFWQAIDTVAREADLQLSLYDKDGKIGLRDGPNRGVPVSYSGMFRVTAKRITAVRDLESDAHLCTVHLEIAWEPRFQPLFFQTRPDNLEATDDKGIALEAPNAGGGRAPSSGRITTDMPVVIAAPRRNVSRLGLLKGDFTVVGPSKMLNFTFDRLAKVDKKTPPERVPTQTQEGVTVKMRQFLTESDLWTVSFLLDYPPDGPDFESFESWLVNNEIQLEGKDGKRYGAGGYEIDEQAGHRAIVTYRFVEDNGLVLDKPENYKLIYRTPGLIGRVPIHFEFKDLPLP